MEIFHNKINPVKFKSTNYIWNRLKLNSPWSVGYVSTLIESQKFRTKEEWKQYYYQSGVERLQFINSNCTEEEKQKLLDFKKFPSMMSDYDKGLNFYYGRTEEELNLRGKYMYEEIMKLGNPLHITLEECCYMVKFRVIGETWNGIMAREHNTISTLKTIFPTILFKKVSGQDDLNYAIDYELYENNRLICAIQIKPLSYHKGFSKVMIQAKKINESKNLLYKQKKNVDVLYVYANGNGTILNEEVITEIKRRKGNDAFDGNILLRY